MSSTKAPISTKEEKEYQFRVGNKAKPKEPRAARKRWQNIYGKVVAQNAFKAHEEHFDPYDQGLIEEIKRTKQRGKVKESVLSLLKTQANLTEKVFARQKYSAKEMLIRKRAANTKTITAGLRRFSQTESGQEYIEEYNRKAQLRYKITPQIREKLDKIKAKNEAEEKKKKAWDESGKQGFWSFFTRLLNSSIFGQTIFANPRFYSMDPYEHLPHLCRRCRRPLMETLEARFTSIGILFLIFFPIIGILLLFANREFVCVICEEIYVYGDLTARPEEEYDDDDVDQQISKH